MIHHQQSVELKSITCPDLESFLYQPDSCISHTAVGETNLTQLSFILENSYRIKLNTVLRLRTSRTSECWEQRMVPGARNPYGGRLQSRIPSPVKVVRCICGSLRYAEVEPSMMWPGKGKRRTWWLNCFRKTVRQAEKSENENTSISRRTTATLSERSWRRKTIYTKMEFSSHRLYSPTFLAVEQPALIFQSKKQPEEYFNFD
jgi:hypothetical protein